MYPDTTHGTHGGLPALLLEEIGEGIGVVDAHGELLWMNHRFEALDPETMRRFCECCRDLADELNRDGMDRRMHLRSFRSGDRAYEVAITPLAPVGADPAQVERVVGVLHNITPRQRILDRVDAVDAAGAELLALDAHIINPLNVAERLKLIEARIVHTMEQLFGVREFEIRLLDIKTQKLELVTSRGIDPMPPGRFLYASTEGNGITGRVASAGESHLCRDAAADPLFLAGLVGARSSMTVPLFLKDRVVGVLNAESRQAACFEEEDLLCLELFGRYVAMALNILDMLIVERYTTNQRVSGALREEIAVPLTSMRQAADRLRQDPDVPQESLVELDRAIGSIEARVRCATDGPQTVLGVDRLDRSRGTDPDIAGRRIAVLDDEAGIRDAVTGVLSDAGAVVDSFESGDAGCNAIELAGKEGRPYDIIVSDVRMPERNGFEVFRTSKAASARTQVILMTGFGYDPNHSIVRSSQEGLHCFLFKPFQAQQLLDEVRKAAAEWRGEQPLA